MSAAARRAALGDAPKPEVSPQAVTAEGEGETAPPPVARRGVRQRIEDVRAGRTWPAWLGQVLRRHWLASALLAVGLALRIITWLAYQPALLYIDSAKYLYNAWEGEDPVGYKVPLRLLLAIGNLGTVRAAQALCGLLMGVIIYALLLRRGANRYLAALAMAPVLLDAYELQAEQVIMPDVIFLFMIVLAFAVLLWQPTASWTAVIATGLLIGFAVTVREVGLILIVPTVLYLLIARREPWIDLFVKCVALVIAFIVPIFLYCSISYEVTGHFWLSSKGSLAGRMAKAVDCQTISLPPAVKPLCPTKAEQKQSADWLDHSIKSPLVNTAAKGKERLVQVSEFDHAVEHQQRLRVVASVLRDATTLFEVNRPNSPGVTPIWRWQFQKHYPTFLDDVYVRPDGTVVIGYQVHHSSPFRYYNLPRSWGGKAKVIEPLASFLRTYQLDGGYTPGPLLLLFTIFGLIGSLIALVRRWSSPRGRKLALASGYFFVAAAGLLLVADVYVFSWRYQLMALVTLPLAGVLGFEALLDLFRRRRPAGDAPAAASSDAASTNASVA